MKDAVLRDYFENLISTDILYMDVEGSEVKTSYDVISVYIDQIKDGSEYIVTKDHLLKLCNDALSGNLKMSHLTTIAFALEFSDYFTPDSDEDDVVAKVIFDWDNPEINYPITIENLIKWKHYLETGEDLFLRRQL
jgi:hypothetical protein